MRKNYVYAKTNLKSFQRRLEFLFWSLIHYKESKSLFEHFLQSPLHIKIASNHPMILRKIFRRYMYCNMPTAKKTELLLSHYTFIFDTFNDEWIKAIYNTRSSFNLCDLVINDITLRAELCYLAKQEREGELMIQLVDSNNRRLYSLAFSFVSIKNGLSILIGGMQGCTSEYDSSNEIIRNLTKQMYGLRPRSLLIFILRTLAEYLGINRLEAVSTKKNITQCRRAMFKRFNKIDADYDLYWKEEGGIREGHIFVLPVQEKRKNFDEIKSNKRSMYTKRYTMMDNLARSIKEKLQLAMK